MVWNILTNNNDYTNMKVPSEKNLTAMFNLIEAAAYIYAKEDNDFFNMADPYTITSKVHNFLTVVSLKLLNYITYLVYYKTY